MRHQNLTYAVSKGRLIPYKAVRHLEVNSYQKQLKFKRLKFKQLKFKQWKFLEFWFMLPSPEVWYWEIHIAKDCWNTTKQFGFKRSLVELTSRQKLLLIAAKCANWYQDIIGWYAEPGSTMHGHKNVTCSKIRIQSTLKPRSITEKRQKFLKNSIRQFEKDSIHHTALDSTLEPIDTIDTELFEI